jgi:hypothetical protein
MAEAKDSLVIFGILIFVGLLIVRGLYLLGQHIDQQNYERRRFYLSVAADLDRLDKIIAESKTKPDLITSEKWAGRN